MPNTNGYIFLKFPIDIQLRERIHRSYYSEMDFGIGRMDGLTLKHGTLKYVFTSGGWKISEIQTTNNLIYTLSKNSFCQFYKILIK